MRLSLMAFLSWILLTAACVRRPPPIKSPPGGTPSGAAPECTVVNGIDMRGDPECSAGCKWDRAQKQCIPAPETAPPPPPSTAPPPAPPPPSTAPPQPSPDSI